MTKIPTHTSKLATFKAAVWRMLRVFAFSFAPSFSTVGMTKAAYLSAAVAALETAFRTVVPSVGVFATRITNLVAKYVPQASSAVATLDPSLAPAVQEVAKVNTEVADVAKTLTPAPTVVVTGPTTVTTPAPTPTTPPRVL